MRQTYERAFPLHELAVSWEQVDFASYDHILITGPQRSGTTFFTKQLAQRLRYAWIDEMDTKHTLTDRRTGARFKLPGYGLSHLPVTWQARPAELRLLYAQERYVAQRPQWTSALHRLEFDAGTLVVFVGRNCLDVFASQNKIMMDGAYKTMEVDANYTQQDTGWTCRYGRTVEWRHYAEDAALRPHVDLAEGICQIKQNAFRRYQQPLMDARGVRSVVVDYDSFATLADFVDGDHRRHVSPKMLAAGP